jgi:hypothetical protein
VKVAALVDVLIRYADALEALGATGTARHLRALIEALTPSTSAKVSDFADMCSMLSFSKEGVPPVLAELVPAMESLSKLLSGVAKPALINDLNLLTAVAHSRSDVPISTFASVIRQHVASASKRRSKGGAALVNQHLVDDYLKQLEANLGNDMAFRALFRDLEADKRVTKLEAVELATRFRGPTPASTSRPKALQRVLERHQKIVAFQRSSESIRGGRPAEVD